MSEQITVTLPAIDATIIETIERETASTHDSEAAAIAAIREKYAHLARHNGDIKIGRRVNGNPNYSFDDAAYLMKEGCKVKGLLCFDTFDKQKTAEWSGIFSGERLYLTADGWIEIKRAGSWSQYQNSTDVWTCGDVTFENDTDENSDYGPASAGHVKVLTDANVLAEGYSVLLLCETLAKSLKTLGEKLPERLTRIRERASLASKLLEALK